MELLILFLFLFIVVFIAVLINKHTVVNENDDTNVVPTVSDSKPVEIRFAVKGTSYRDDDAIELAQELEEGDFLELERDYDNEYDHYAVKVMVDETCIGYVDRKYSKAFAQNIGSFKKCVVDHVSSHDIPFIDAVATFDGDADIEAVVDTARVHHPYSDVTVRFIMPGDREREEFPELNEAFRLRHKDPQKAVQIFLSVMDKEEGFFSAHEALKCYRDMGEFQKEKDLILKILEKCKGDQYEDYRETYESRLHSVEYFLGKERRKRDLDKAKAYFLDKDYESALTIYQQYFDKSDVVLNVADALRKCYDKLGQKDKEKEVIEIVLSQKLSASARDRFQKYLDKLAN